MADAPLPSAEGAATLAARNGVAAAIAEIGGKVSTLILMIVAARVLGRAEFGAYAYALAVGGLVSALPSWGLDPLLVRSGAGRSSVEVSRLLATTLTIRVMIAVPVFLATAGVGLLTRPTAATQLAFVVVVLGSLLETVGTACRSAAAAVQRQPEITAVLIAQRLIVAVLGVGAIAAGWGLLGLAVAYGLGVSLGVGYGFHVLRRLDLRPRWSEVRSSEVRGMLRESVPVGLDTLVATVLFRADAVLIAVFLGDSAVGLYAAAYRLVETVMFINWSIGGATLPALTRASVGEPIRKVMRGALGVMGAIFIPYSVVLIVRGDDVLRLFFGPEYVNGHATLAWLSLAPLAFGASYLLSSGLLAARLTGRLLVASAVAAVANVVANIIVIPAFGPAGAAATTTLSYVLEIAVLLALARGTFRFADPLRAWLLPAVASLVPVLVCLLPLPLLAALPLAAGLYLGFLLLLAWRFVPEQVEIGRALVRGRT